MEGRINLGVADVTEGEGVRGIKTAPFRLQINNVNHYTKAHDKYLFM
jgi:hypothetical protein